MMMDKYSEWLHDHVFHISDETAESGTRLVLWITAITMIVEIGAGCWFNSMALLADGWHMSSHAVAIGLSVLAYGTARRYALDQRFAFGTWKIEILGGYTSALFLVGVAIIMVASSIERIASPQPIHYKEAIVIAILGLIVNVICAIILGKAHHHGHEHDHSHEEHNHHHDLNLKSAYIHVMADAATSVLAIAALIGGWVFNWSWLDPIMGIIGAILVVIWAKGLIIQTGKVLLDREMDHPIVDEIREVLSTSIGSSRIEITDLHVWRVGKQVYSCAITIVTDDNSVNAKEIRRRLSVHEEIVHSTIEMHYLDHSIGSIQPIKVPE